MFCLYDSSSAAVLSAEEKLIRQSKHPAEPVHHHHLQFGAGRTRDPDQKYLDYLKIKFYMRWTKKNRLWNFWPNFIPGLRINVGLHSLVTWMESNSRISISPFYHSTIVLMLSVFQVALSICFKIVFNYLFSKSLLKLRFLKVLCLLSCSNYLLKNLL